MKCTVCGSGMEHLVTDLPFKVGPNTIVIMKGLPVHQCPDCGDYLIEDAVMARVESILGAANQAIELEIVRYAA